MNKANDYTMFATITAMQWWKKLGEVSVVVVSVTDTNITVHLTFE